MKYLGSCRFGWLVLSCSVLYPTCLAALPPITWTNTSGGNWSIAVNWSPNQVPGPNDPAVISGGGSYTVTLDVNATIAALTLGGIDGQQTLAVGAKTLIINSGATVDTNAVLTVAGGTVSGSASVSGTANWNGTLNGSWTLARGGVMSWTGGSLGAGASLTVATGGSLTLNGTASKYLYGALTNAGTVNWANGALQIANNGGAQTGAIVNQSGGAFEIQCDQSLYNYYGTEPFVNAGTIHKSAGSGSTYLYPVLTNSGLVSVASGSFVLYGGGTLAGTFNTGSSNSFVNLNQGTFTVDPAVVFGGLGTSEMTGGSLTLVSNVIPNLQLLGGSLSLGANFQGGTITNLALNGMTLLGTNTVSGTLSLLGNGQLSGPTTVNGTLTLNGNINSALTVASGGVMTWSGGLLSPHVSLTVAPAGLLNLIGSAYKQLEGPLTNSGTMVWTNGPIQIINIAANNSGAYTGEIINQPGALFEIQCDQAVYTDFNAAFEVITNAGTIHKSAGSGTTYFYTGLVNSGAVNVDSGTLLLYGGGSLAGTFNTGSNNGVINLNGGSFTYDPAVVFSGLGTSEFTGGSLSLLNNVIPNLQLLGGTLSLGPSFQGGTITNLTLSGVNLQGTNTVGGTLSLLGNGQLSGPTTVNGTLTFNGNINAALTVATNGVMSWTGGVLNQGVPLTVAPGALLNLKGTAYKQLEGPLTNSGTIVWIFGPIQILNSAANNSGAYTGEIINQSGALFEIQCDQAVYTYFNQTFEVITNAGTIHKSASSGPTYFYTAIENTGAVNVDSGTLYLYGGGSLAGTFNTGSNNSTINLRGGSFTYDPAVVFGGTGTSEFTGGSLTLLNDVIPNLQLLGGTLSLSSGFQGGTITNLTLSGVNLQGTNSVTGTLSLLGGGQISGPTTVNGTLTLNGNINAALTVATNGVMSWTGGVLNQSVPLAVASGGLLNLIGTAYKQFEGPLTNSGTIVWTNGPLQILNNAANNSGAYTGEIINQAGALFEIQCDQGVYAYFNQAFEIITNAGTIHKSAGSGTTYSYTGLENSGAVNVDSGTLVLYGGGSLAGTFHTGSSNSVINLNGGSFTYDPAVVFGGLGTSEFTGGSLTLLNDVIPNLQLLGGTLSLSPSFQGGTITNLTLSGVNLQGTNTVTGTLSLSGQLSGPTTVNGSLTFNGSINTALTVASGGVMTWTGGLLNPRVPLTVAPGALLNLIGTAYKQFEGPLTNSGTIVWTNGPLQIINNAANNSGAYTGEIINQAGALFEIQCDQVVYAYFNQAFEVITNAGTIHKSAGNGTTYSYAGIENTGAVNVDSGTLLLYGGGSLAGTFNTGSSNGVVNLNGGSFTYDPAVVFSGLGTSEFTGGSLTLLNNVIPNLQLLGGTLSLSPSFQGGTITNLTLSGVTLQGANTVSGTLSLLGGGQLNGPTTVNGTLTFNGNINAALTVASGGVMSWTGGVLNQSVPLAVASGGLMNLIGAAYKEFAGPLTNSGTIVWTNGPLQILNNAANNSGSYTGEIINQAGARFEIQCDQGVYTYFNQAFEVITNAGTIHKSVGSGTTFLFSGIENSGTINVDSGTLALYGGGRLAGTFDTGSSNSVVNFNQGTFTTDPAVVIGGLGTSEFTGGSLTLLNDVIPNLQLLGGTLSLSPNFQGGTITNLTLSGVILQGTNTVSGTLSLYGNGQFSGPTTVNGTLAFNGIINAALTVASGGVMSWTGGTLNQGVPLTVAPGGLLNLIGTSYKQLEGPLTNSGTMVWTNGPLQILNNAANNSGAYTGEIINQSGARFEIQCDQGVYTYFNQAFEIITNAGTVHKSGAQGTTTVNAGFGNTGTVVVDSGIVDFYGVYSQSGGELSFGLNSVSDYGRITIDGGNSRAVFGGTLDLHLNNGYFPALSNTFTLLNYTANGGFFTNSSLPLEYNWLTNYGATAFSVQITNVIPVAISQSPVSQTVGAGANLSLQATATGPVPLEYQWMMNGNALPGATNSTLSLPHVTTAQSGLYALIASDGAASATSQVATVIVGLPGCSPPPSGLVAWWPADGNTHDTVGGNDGTLMGGAGYANGEVGSAFSFNGSSDFVQAPANAAWDFGTNDFSIQLWLNLSLTTGTQALLADDDGPGVLNKWIFWLNNGLLQFHLNGSSIGGPVTIGTGAFAPAPLSWHHLALTHTRGTYTFYVDGALLDTEANGLAIPASSAPLTMGSAEGGFFLNGTLDEVAIFNRALTATEVQGLASAGSAGMCNGLPSIGLEPTNQTVLAGSTVTLTVAAGGTPSPTYQWQFNGTNVPGATAPTLLLSQVTTTQSGPYTVIVSNAVGVVVSSVAFLSVGTAPVITTQPQGQTVAVSSNVTFTSAATGSVPLSYQWQLNGTNLVGATSATLALTGVTSSQAGPYLVVVTNAWGAVTSTVAQLTVTTTTTSSARIAGVITYYSSGTNVPSVGIALAGAASATATTAADGTYSFTVPLGGNFTITPSRTTETPANQGVTTLDLLLIRRHILALAPLTSPYALLAADADGSGTITTLDIAHLRQLIFLDTNNLPAGLWRFVPADFTWTNQQQPWVYPLGRTYTSVAGDALGQNYIAIKLGDVDAAWQPAPGTVLFSANRANPGEAGLASRDPASNRSVGIRASSQSAALGETVRVPIVVNGFNDVTTAQFTLTWDPTVLAFAGLENLALPGLEHGNFSTTRTGEGRLAFSWDDFTTLGVSVPDGAAIYTVVFQARKANSTTAISFGDQPTPREITVNAQRTAVASEGAAITIHPVTGPLVLSVAPSSLAPTQTGMALSLSLPTVAGKTYVLEYTDSIGAPNWRPLAQLVGDDTIRTFADLPAGGQQRFYRVRMP